jgi:DMSO/TMAO reductase YedYZ molybdopterin-dependent catalytic subunit
VTEAYSFDELQLSKRNHGLLLEALRYPITPLGMHYTLSHYDVPAIDGSAWQLSIGGLVERPFALDLDELRSLPVDSLTVTMECAGNGRARMQPRPISIPWVDEAVATARWTGTKLAPLLDRAGVLAEAVEVVFTASDRGFEGGTEQCFARSLSVARARESRALLAYEMNGMPLPPQHGYPVRLVVPGWYGMASVKWLERIEAVAEPFRGHHQSVAYVLRDMPGEVGTPVTLMLPRALMVPPGIPTFLDRHRTVELGECVLEGRAWSGEAALASVEVSADGGGSWFEAELEHDVDFPFAWRAWSFRWSPSRTGEYELCCRARDLAGNVQPDEPVVNLGGYCNNSVQRVGVTVR